MFIEHFQNPETHIQCMTLSGDEAAQSTRGSKMLGDFQGCEIPLASNLTVLIPKLNRQLFYFPFPSRRVCSVIVYRLSLLCQDCSTDRVNTALTYSTII